MEGEWRKKEGGEGGRCAQDRWKVGDKRARRDGREKEGGGCERTHGGKARGEWEGRIGVRK